MFFINSALNLSENVFVYSLPTARVLDNLLPTVIECLLHFLSLTRNKKHSLVIWFPLRAAMQAKAFYWITRSDIQYLLLLVATPQKTYPITRFSVPRSPSPHHAPCHVVRYSLSNIAVCLPTKTMTPKTASRSSWKALRNLCLWYYWAIKQADTDSNTTV